MIFSPVIVPASLMTHRYNATPSGPLTYALYINNGGDGNLDDLTVDGVPCPNEETTFIGNYAIGDVLTAISSTSDNWEIRIPATLVPISTPDRFTNATTRTFAVPDIGQTTNLTLKAKYYD